MCYFQRLEVVGRGSETQPQVAENLNDIIQGLLAMNFYSFSFLLSAELIGKFPFQCGYLKMTRFY